MKLNYSTSTSIQALVIHLLLLMNHLSTQQTLADDESVQDEQSAGEFSKNQKDMLVKVMKRNILKTLGLKEEPIQPPDRKVVVPVQLLEEYKKFRSAAKQSIPNDSDYYGKIDIHAVEKRHADYYKSGIVVDMAEGSDTGFLFKGGPIKQITELPLASDPEDVPAKFEHMLPPINKQQKQFISVHMKFNLSQDLNSVQELKGAELHLTRERMNDSELDKCDTDPVPLSGSLEQTLGLDEITTTANEQDNNSTATIDTTTTTINPAEDEAEVVRQRYQRVYLLQVQGHDKNNEPITRIHDSMRIDTHQSTMLRFDIHKIVKEWLQEPTKRYGIIVRVTNDDEEYKELERKIKSSIIITETNASTQTPAKAYQKISPTVEDHIRLKRQFRLTSESTETWEHHLPRLFVFINPQPQNMATTGERYHVKREHLASEAVATEESIQADQPTEDSRDDYITNRPKQIDHTTTSSTTTEHQQQFTSDGGVQASSISPYSTQQPNKPTTASNKQKQSAGPYQNQELFNNSTTKRSMRAGVRASSSSVNQKSRSRAKATKMVEKCSKRSLSINFDEVGWSSWIIAPQVYHTSYCYGDCSYPLSDQQDTSNHAIIQSIFHSVGRAVPRPCCVPTKLGNIAILYQLDGVVQMRHYEDMIIEACGCQ